jgi:hypothetical protein
VACGADETDYRLPGSRRPQAWPTPNAARLELISVCPSATATYTELGSFKADKPGGITTQTRCKSAGKQAEGGAGQPGPVTTGTVVHCASCGVNGRVNLSGFGPTPHSRSADISRNRKRRVPGHGQHPCGPSAQNRSVPVGRGNNTAMALWLEVPGLAVRLHGIQKAPGEAPYISHVGRESCSKHSVAFGRRET